MHFNPFFSSWITISITVLITSCMAERIEWSVTSPILTLPAVFPITSSNQLNLNGFMLSEAFKCAVGYVKDANIIPGLQITMDVRDSGRMDATLLGKEFISEDRVYPFVYMAGSKESALAMFKEVRDVNVSLFVHVENTMLDSSLA